MTEDEKEAIRAFAQNRPGSLIKLAEAGNVEAARDVLEEFCEAVEMDAAPHPEILQYVARAFRGILESVPLDRALGLEDDVNPGGTPKRYDDLELAAADILLRDHAGLKPGKAHQWLELNTQISKSQIGRIRREFDSRYNRHTDAPLMESISREDLLRLSGKLRQNLAGVLKPIT